MNTTANSNSSSSEVLYQEQQWVPWYWWLAAVGIAALTAATIARNRSDVWFWVPFLIFVALGCWALWQLSSTRLKVEEDPDGLRWLSIKGANLPATVVSRFLAVPATAKRNAMGRQLDPSAFVVSKSWIPEMVMLVLDDPEDSTPYWLITTKNPEAVLTAFQQ
ncbi:DUF3093 domain-containing protein [Corynebacterium sp. H128]|uniref:DUF3093 domain-containing protein n=1 Tax=Corynebacterium sp. H128 TaxID=3133427 RepID=UPI0030B00C3E